MRFPHTFTIVFFLVILVAILTYILPSGSYDRVKGEGTASGKTLVIPGSYKPVASNPQGFLAVMTSFSEGLKDAAEIIAFVLIIGGAYGVILKTGTIESGINRAIEKFGNRGILLIPILMLLFSIGGTTTGMAEETLPFCLVLVPLMIALGYDSLVAIAIVHIGAGVGVLASTVNPFATGIASAIAEITIAEGLYLRLVLYTTSIITAIVYVMLYAAKIKKDPSKSVIFSLKEEHTKFFIGHLKDKKNIIFTWQHKSILILFFLMIMTMIYGLIALGWWMGEITMLFLSVAILAAIITKMNNNQFWEAFVSGSKDLLSVALIIGLARGIVIVAQNGNIMDSILFSASEFLSGLSKYSFILLNGLIQTLIAFLIPSTSGHAALTIPIMAPLADLFSIKREAIVTAYQSASGWANLITPTSGVTMGCLAIGRISLTNWLKFIAPFLIIQMLIIAIFLIISVI